MANIPLNNTDGSLLQFDSKVRPAHKACDSMTLGKKFVYEMTPDKATRSCNKVLAHCVGPLSMECSLFDELSIGVKQELLAVGCAKSHYLYFREFRLQGFSLNAVQIGQITSEEGHCRTFLPLRYNQNQGPAVSAWRCASPEPLLNLALDSTVRDGHYTLMRGHSHIRMKDL